MRIGFFTDTYFPQVSGVSTSIKTLKEELEKLGHEVYIFTTTDPDADEFEKDIVRMPSVPFVSFKDRRIVVRGIFFAYQIAKELQLDIIHTHTEFGAGFLGKMVANRLHVPVIHTYHTMYEDYLHYIANGKVVRPSHVKRFVRIFVNHSTGVICPSKRVVETLARYGVDIPMRIIPTGIEVERFKRPEITLTQTSALRRELGITPEQKMILSLSRVSYEKNIQAIVREFSKVVAKEPAARLVIVGKGPYQEALRQLVVAEKLTEVVQFTGEVPNDRVAYYYRAADYFVSASSSETQGLTYAESIASGTQCVVKGNDYLDQLIDDEHLGVTFAADEDFAQTLLAYMEQAIPFDLAVQSQKLLEVSAEHFGKRVEAFYCDMLKYYETQCKAEDYETTTRRKIKLALKNPENK